MKVKPELIDYFLGTIFALFLGAFLGVIFVIKNGGF